MKEGKEEKIPLLFFTSLSFFSHTQSCIIPVYCNRHTYSLHTPHLFISYEHPTRHHIYHVYLFITSTIPIYYLSTHIRRKDTHFFYSTSYDPNSPQFCPTQMLDKRRRWRPKEGTRCLSPSPPAPPISDYVIIICMHARLTAFAARRPTLTTDSRPQRGLLNNDTQRRSGDGEGRLHKGQSSPRKRDGALPDAGHEIRTAPAGALWCQNMNRCWLQTAAWLHVWLSH